MRKCLKKIVKIFLIALAVILLLVILGLFYVNYALKEVPENCPSITKNAEVVDSSTTKVENSWIRHEQKGLWTLYVEGKPYERGVTIGVLSKELIAKQESAFFNQIHRLIPSNTYLGFLKYFIACFNYNLYSYIPEEYKKEIYGVSKSVSHEFDFIGTPYQRQMNYHGAHDLGHLLQNIGLVACSSFGAWDSKTKDGDLLIGRNFDFYVGDEFAEEKIVEFIRPDSGYPHAIITWGGMMGVVSGMNDQGLTVTINAANSEIPFKTATPVSIVARNILQYAANIEQAVKIASTFKVFVSEQFLIGSAADNRAIVIEKTPKKQDVFSTDKNYIISTNHFQSASFGNLVGALVQRDSTPSGYRMRRIDQLISSITKIDYNDAAQILRDTSGINNATIGLGNEKAVNQLIAHHSIIFSPKKRIFWISTSPFQLGRYVAYDLNKVFKMKVPMHGESIQVDSIAIEADSLFLKNGYKRYKEFQSIVRIKDDTLGYKSRITRTKQLNPNYFYTYEFAGDQFANAKNYQQAIDQYEQALKYEIPSAAERKRIVNKTNESRKHIKK